MKDVTAAIMLDKNLVFIARRAKGQSCAGGWEFPGGKIEIGESPEQCLCRELFEEFEVEVRVGDFFAESIYEYSQGVIRLMAYFVTPLSNSFQLRVHDEYRWVKISELLSCGLLPADIPIAEKLIDSFSCNSGLIFFKQAKIE